MRVPVTPHLCQHLVLSVFWILAILIAFWMLFYALDCWAISFPLCLWAELRTGMGQPSAGGFSVHSCMGTPVPHQEHGDVVDAVLFPSDPLIRPTCPIPAPRRPDAPGSQLPPSWAVVLSCGDLSCPRLDWEGLPETRMGWFRNTREGSASPSAKFNFPHSLQWTLRSCLQNICLPLSALESVPGNLASDSKWCWVMTIFLQLLVGCSLRFPEE